MRNKIRLETLSDVQEFVNLAATRKDAKITVTDSQDLRVNAKSLMGMLYALEFDELWVESDTDTYTLLKKFIIEE